MSYLILARKWRPQKFSDVIGQEHVTETLKRAVLKNRLAHAYLFAGPRGCGKTTTARLLAKVINCSNPKEGEPCNQCASCRSVMDGGHMDVIEIDGASNRGIDEIRDLREKIGYTPTQSVAKIYIIDEVHMLTPQAFNALLKTLEEPPEHVYMVFATTEPHKIPSTILSRCQRFNFKRLGQDELAGQLERICKAEKMDFRDEALFMLARRAEGSMRDAESLLDQCMSASEERIDLDLVRKVLGLVDSHLIIELLGVIGKRDKARALEIVDSAVGAGFDLVEFFIAYIEGLRNLLLLSVGEDSTLKWMDMTTDEIKEAREVARPFKTEDLLYLFRSAVRYFRQFKGSGQQRYLLEAAVAEAASWDSAVELAEVLDKLEKFGGGGKKNRGGTGGKAMDGRKDEVGRVDRSAGEGGDDREKAGRSKVVERYDSGEGGDFTSRGGEVKGKVSGHKKSSGKSFSSKAVKEAERRSAAVEKLGGTESWEKFLSRIRERKLTLGIWLTSAEVEDVTDDTIVLGFSPQNRFAREMIKESKNKRYIESQLENFFGREYAVETDEVKISDKNKVEEEHEEYENGQDKYDDDIGEDIPVVAKKLMEEFGGRLIRGKEQQGRDRK